MANSDTVMGKFKGKLLFVVAVIIPLLATITTTAMWVDTRYMHKEISDTRFIDLQIKILEMGISEHENKVDSGEPISVSATRNYQLNIKQMEDLMRERNKLLGIGE